MSTALLHLVHAVVGGEREWTPSTRPRISVVTRDAVEAGAAPQVSGSRRLRCRAWHAGR